MTGGRSQTAKSCSEVRGGDLLETSYERGMSEEEDGEFTSALHCCARSALSITSAMRAPMTRTTRERTDNGVRESVTRVELYDVC